MTWFVKHEQFLHRVGWPRYEAHYSEKELHVQLLILFVTIILLR